MRLDSFNNANFERGRSYLVEALWRAVEGLLFSSWIPGSAWRAALLRFFGAKVGRGVVIKPRVKIKFPWKLKIGKHSWIGEQAWIDNLAEVEIGSHCCISQGVYMCTGNHRWDRHSFDLVTKPIRVEDHCWIGAKAKISPGVICHSGAVLTIGSIATSHLKQWHIHAGNPARPIKVRPVSGTLADD